MQRRDFLKGLLASGCLTLPLLRTRPARAADSYRGPFLITLQARGGWDPTFCFDGKLPNEALQLPYAEPAALGAFTYAPMVLRDGSTQLDTVKGFLTDLGSRLAVINGIDTQTNSHSTGMKHVWSGRAFEQLPSLAAFYAAAKLGELQVPMPYLSRGGYEDTGSVVQLTRISSPSVLRSVAYPNVVGGSTTWHDTETYGRVERAAAARLQRLGRSGLMPAESGNFQALASARAAASGLETYTAALPASIVTTRAAFPELNYDDGRLSTWLQSVQTALYAFASGVALSANVSTDGTSFDTHAEHDVKHGAELGKFLLLIRYLFRLADELQLSDRLFVVVGSDFGRTPTYNAAGGKDHWNVTSMLAAGPSIKGGRVHGGTDDELRPLRVDTRDPAKLLDSDDPGGERLLPAHVHRALRKAMAIDSAPLSARFPLSVAAPFDGLLSS